MKKHVVAIVRMISAAQRSLANVVRVSVAATD
jgi:hypothetical protein